MFSNCLLRFVREITGIVPQPSLGPILHDAFTQAIQEADSPTVIREIQMMGRIVLRERFDTLLANSPDVLSPLGLLVKDPKGDPGANNTRPICVRSRAGSAVGVNLARAIQTAHPKEGVRLILTVFQNLKQDLPDKDFHLFKALGKQITNEAYLPPGSWLDLKPADASKAPQKEARPTALIAGPPLEIRLPGEEPRRRRVHATQPVKFEEKIDPFTEADMRQILNIPDPPEEPRSVLTEEEVQQILRRVDEDPKKNADALENVDFHRPVKVSSVTNIVHPDPLPRAANIVPESFSDYQHVLRNDPAFVGPHYHSKHGLLLVMIAVDGYNELRQTVYRGGAVYHPKANRLETHKYMDTVIGPIRWTDEDGAQYNVKGVPWQRGLVGKYWTNIQRGTEKDDIEEMKRWFVLTTDKVTGQPAIEFWSGPRGEANFNAYLNALRRRMREIRKKAA